MQHVLLIHGGAVGDFVMTLRLVAGLRSRGVKTVTVLGRPSIARIGLLGGGVDRVLDLEAGGYHALFSPDAEIPGRVRQTVAGVDTVIDMLGSQDTPLPTRLRELGVGCVIQVDPRPRDTWHEHITNQWLSDLREAGIELDAKVPQLVVNAAKREQAMTRLAWNEAGAERPKVILHPGSGGPHKCWPLTSFLQLSEQLRQAGCETRFLLGPVETECMSCEDVERIQTAALLLTGLPLEDAAACLACADAFVGNDSGISHLAAAVGTRTLTIFGPTNPRLWRPLGSQVTVLQAESPAAWPDVSAARLLIAP